MSINNLTNLRQAIKLANLDCIKDLTISMEDLLLLDKSLADLEQQAIILKGKSIEKDIQIANLVSESINMRLAPKLDKYA